jgi:probable HAF family extracellular repeat protein
MLTKICFVILSVFGSLALHAEVEYDIVPLLPAGHVPSPGKVYQTFPKDMSRTGYIVGRWEEFEDYFSDPVVGGFVYHELLGYQNIEIPGATDVSPEKVNIHGVIAGTCITTENCFFIYDSVTQTVTYLEPITSSGIYWMYNCEIYAITQDGRVLIQLEWDDESWEADLHPSPEQKVIKLQQDFVALNNNADIITANEFIPRFGERQSFGSLDPYGRWDVQAEVLSDTGVVAGYGYDVNFNEVGFLWDCGKGLRSFPSLGGEYLSVDAINIHSQVAGTALNEKDRVRAFFYDDESGVINLGTLKGHNYSEARDINDQGFVVGISTIEDKDEKDRAFIWDKQHGMRDLSLLHSGGSDWKCLEEAHKINPDGSIMGLGVYRGDWCAFLLIPKN